MTTTPSQRTFKVVFFVTVFSWPSQAVRSLIIVRTTVSGKLCETPHSKEGCEIYISLCVLFCVSDQCMEEPCATWRDYDFCRRESFALFEQSRNSDLAKSGFRPCTFGGVSHTFRGTETGSGPGGPEGWLVILSFCHRSLRCEFRPHLHVFLGHKAPGQSGFVRLNRCENRCN